MRRSSEARAVGCLVLFAAIVAGCGFFPEEEDPTPIELPEPARTTREITYPVQRMDLYDQIESSAVIEAVNQRAMYFTRSGRLTAVTVEPQDTIRAGQLLAQLDAEELAFQVGQAEIDVQIARLQSQLGGGVSTVEARISELNVRRQELRLEYLRSQLAGATIRAPFDGVVERVHADPGEEVVEFETVIELGDPRDIQILVRLSADEYLDVFAGLRARVEVDDDDWRDGTVVRTFRRDSSTDPTIRRDTYFARVQLDEPAPMRLNSRHSARIIMQESLDTLAIPLGALRQFQDDTFVRVLDGEVRREVYVQTGIRTATRVEIVEGLEEGDLVIGQ